VLNNHDAKLMNFIINGKVTWELNWQTCCSLGMEPLVIDSLKELKCLSNVTKNGTWTGNFNYWTGGTQKDCRGSWTWCGKEGARVFNDDVTWDKNQPDNKGGNEDCIHLKLKKNNVTGQPQEFILTDRNCSDKYVLACKVLSNYLLETLVYFC
jgi:Lectin C-type domain